MPIKADVVIIGGGVMGCAIAYNLAKEGLKPVVIEKSDIGGEASGSNGGGVRQSARNLKEMPLAMESIQIYGQLHEELGMDVEYVREGNLRLCTTEEEVETMRRAVENQKEVGLHLEMLDRKQVLEINPHVGEKVIVFNLTSEIPNDVVAVRGELPDSLKQAVYDAIAAYLDTDEGKAVFDEIYEWTAIQPADDATFDVVRDAAVKLGITEP